MERGLGLTFNPHEKPVEGYSNFLWIIMCSVLGYFKLDIAEWAPRIGLAFGVATLCLMWLVLLRRNCSLHHTALVLLLMALSAPFVLYSVSGLETPLYSFLLLLACVCAEFVIESGYKWFAVVLLSVTSVLVALCRLEGIVLFPVLITLLLIFGDRRYPTAGIVLAIGVFVISMIAYHAWRFSYFGELFPTPFLSKGISTSMLNTWSTNFQFYFVRQNHNFAPFGYYYGGLFLIAILGLIVRPFSQKKLRPERVALIVALLYGAIYINFVDWMPGMRYFVPLTGLLLIAIPLDKHFPSSKLSHPTSLSRRPVEIIAAYCVVLAIGLFSIAVLKIDAQRNEDSTRSSLVALGTWLKANVPGNALLAMSDVGATPYFSELRTLDINPRSLTDSHIARFGWSNEYFFQMKPDVVLLVSFSLTKPVFYSEHRQLFNEPRFSEEYLLIGTTRYDWYQDRSYWVFVNKSINLSKEQIEGLPKGISG